MEKTVEFKTTRKPTPKPKNPKALSQTKLKDIEAAIKLIDVFASQHLEGLVNELSQDHGLKLPKAGNLTYTATMHGIEAAPAALVRVALQNWANAARRALLRAEG